MMPFRKKTSKSAVFVLMFLITACSGFLLNEIRDSRRDSDRQRIGNILHRRQTPDQHVSYRNFGQDITEKDSITDNLFDRRSFRTGTLFRHSKIGKNNNQVENDLRFNERLSPENSFREGRQEEYSSYSFLRHLRNTRNIPNRERASRKTDELGDLNMAFFHRDSRRAVRNQIRDTLQDGRFDIRNLRNIRRTEGKNIARNNIVRRFTVEQRREDILNMSEERNKRRVYLEEQRYTSRKIPSQRISDTQINRNEHDTNRNEIRSRTDYSRRLILEEFRGNLPHFLRKISRNIENDRNTIDSRQRLPLEESQRHSDFSREALRQRTIETPSNRFSHQTLLRKLSAAPDERRNVNIEFPRSRILSLFDSIRQETRNDRIIRTKEREDRQRESRRTHFERRQSRQNIEKFENPSRERLERDSRKLNREEYTQENRNIKNREMERRENSQLRRNYSRIVNRQDIRKTTTQRIPSRQERDRDTSRDIHVKVSTLPTERYEYLPFEKVRQNSRLIRSASIREERYQSLSSDFLSDKDNKVNSLRRNMLNEDFSKLITLPTTVDRIGKSMSSRDEFNTISSVDVTKKLGTDIDTNTGMNVWINTIKIVLVAYLVGQMFVTSSAKNKFRFQNVISPIGFIKEKIQ